MLIYAMSPGKGGGSRLATAYAMCRFGGFPVMALMRLSGFVLKMCVLQKYQQAKPKNRRATEHGRAYTTTQAETTVYKIARETRSEG